MAYEAALGQLGSEAAKSADRAPGTFDWLMQKYFESMTYAKMAKSTRYASRLAIERYVREEGLGHRKFCDVRPEHIEKMMTKRAAKPGAANDLLKKMRSLYKFAQKNKWAKSDPTIGAERFKEGEHHTWTDEEILQFEQRWPIGTRERAAFVLLLYTGQRMADVSEMVWTDIVNGASIRVVQNKTLAKLLIPLHTDAVASLKAWPRNHVAIITTDFGQPFSHKGFGNWMADRIRMAGLPDRCVTHGLRKAAARAVPSCLES